MRERCLSSLRLALLLSGLAALPALPETMAAAELQLGGPAVSGVAGGSGEAPVFRFEAPAGRLVIVEAPGLERLEILGPDGSRVAALAPRRNQVAFDSGAGGAFAARLDGLAAGEEYSVSVALAPDDDHGSVAAAATPLKPGAAAVPGDIQFEDDLDFFLISGDPGQVYRAEIAKAEESLSLRAVLVPGDYDNRVPPGTSESWTLLRVPFTLPATGRMLLHVSEPWSEGEGAYTIRLVGPIPDDHGDTAAAATPLTVDAPATPASVRVLEDVDFFSFEARAGEGLLVEITDVGGFSNNAPDLRVLDTDRGTVLGQAEVIDPGVIQARFTAPATGTYFLRLAIFDFAAVTDYQLRVRRADGVRPSLQR